MLSYSLLYAYVYVRNMRQ